MVGNTERNIRDYALHLALIVRRQGEKLALFERYGERAKIGTFRTWPAVKRALDRHCERALESE